VHLGLVISDAAAGAEAAQLLREAGAAHVQTAVLALTEDPVADRLALDAALDAVQGLRIAIALDMATLVPLLHRMMRRGELETADTALLSPVPASLVAQGLPPGLRDAARLAVEGAPRAVGVLKDDSGGVLIDRARLTPWPEPAPDGTPAAARGEFWLRAYVDDQQVSDGGAASLTVTRVRPDLLRATALRPGLLRRRHTVEGRALQLACDDALIESDGVARERPRTKRTWWCEPTMWKVALPSR
jgi:hypothetical protein